MSVYLSVCHRPTFLFALNTTCPISDQALYESLYLYCEDLGISMDYEFTKNRN